jgi:hypothetical protein
MTIYSQSMETLAVDIFNKQVSVTIVTHFKGFENYLLEILFFVMGDGLENGANCQLAND